MVKDGKVISNIVDMYIPEEGGIHPRKAADHHAALAGDILGKALIEKPDAVAYSCGPGIGPCLRVGMVVARYISIKFGIPLIPVNHAVAHIDIGMKTTRAKDPVVVYVSGGNTQIIANVGGWKIFGETLDIALGNAMDKLARELGLEHPGGPKLEKLAKGGSYLAMPYTVKGMDMSFSGIFTHAKRLLKDYDARDVVYSYQEHLFAMLVEVAERAMAHTGKNELLLVGGVAQNKRLKGMFEIMCKARGASFKVVPPELAGDNGAMIAYSGSVSDTRVTPGQSDYFQKLRVDTDLANLFRL